MGLASLLGAGPAYAVAMAGPHGGGRYLVVGHDGSSTLLGTFAGRADLSCHSAAQAAALNESIARSGVVHGSLRARRLLERLGFSAGSAAQCAAHEVEDDEDLMQCRLAATVAPS